MEKDNTDGQMEEKNNLGLGLFILLIQKGFYQLLMINTIVMISSIGPNYREPNNRRIYVFIECVFKHTCYCVQVKLCYVKTVIYKIGNKFW